MKGKMLIISLYIITAIVLIVVLAIKNSKQNKKIRKSISELEREKNLVLGAPILNELSKVEALVKDDKAKYKYDNWQRRFDDIRNIYIPEVTDMLLDADDYLDTKDYKSLRLLLADIELKIYKLREKTEKLLSEIKEITLSEEKNRDQIVKLKTEYRKIKSDYEKNKEEYKPVNNQIE